jgi:hypothetical protein
MEYLSAITGIRNSLNDNEIVGHIAVGKRSAKGWTATGSATYTGFG